jgi:Undecaprenyl-phosphate glucose phosphotransferase
MLMWAASTLAVSLGGRIALCVQLSALEARGVVRERVAVVGSGPAAMRLLARLKRERGRAIEFVGLFDDGAEPSADGVVSDCARLVELGQSNEVDWVIVAMSRPGGDHLHRIVHELKALDVQVALCPEVLETELPNAQIGHFGSLPMMLLVNRPIRKWGLLIKELIDKVVSAAMIVALLPLLLAIAAAIRLDSPGPVIFRQRRHGRNNTEFEVFKFRSMRVATGQASDGRIQAQRNDRRITRIGAFLRKTSLDELPQLFNVLRGDMSLVGPRPHPCEMRTENLLSAEIMAEYAHRHRVKPGITGWAQIRGHRGATETAEQVRSRVECDLFYIENWSLMLDLKILALTPVKLVFDRSNAF